MLSSIANSSPEITAATTKQQTTKNLLQRYNARYNSPTHTSVKQHQQKQKGQRDVNSNPSLNKMQDYPNCNVQRPWSIGNGNCQNTYGYNTAECGFDGGDCEEFNAKYPNCPAPFSSWIGDGFCQNYFNHNTAECGFDGGDCDCIVPYPPKIGDGNCDGGSYNTAECEFDGGDCEEFNKYPDCTVSSPQLFGDGNCDGGNYNTAECGFDGGDCEEFNAKYPNCDVAFPYLIGDGNGDCNGGSYNYNTAECGFDGGDCDFFNKYPNCDYAFSSLIGDGICNYGFYNTVECGFDGGDCEDFNVKYPNCSAYSPSLVGDGNCDNYGNYNTAECGFDGGDCDCNIPYPYLIGDGNCDGDYNTSECGFDGGDCENFNWWLVVGGVAGAILFIAIGSVIWKRKRNTTSTMQQEIAGGGGGVQAGNARIQGNNQSIADNGAPSPSAPTQNETREQKQHNRRFKILTSILQKEDFASSSSSSRHGRLWLIYITTSA